MPERVTFGLLGYPLGHSLSPLIHTAAMEAHGLLGEYRLFPVKDEQEMPSLIQKIREGNLQGLNVTIPYKRDVMPLMDELTPTARIIGAVNTISLQRKGVTGENTDAGGFLADLERLGWFSKGVGSNHALILGAGGSARAIAFGLYNNQWRLTIAARRQDQAEKLASELSAGISGGDERMLATALRWEKAALGEISSSYDLVVNATPVGMHPSVDANPWPEDFPLPEQTAVYDRCHSRYGQDYQLPGKRCGAQ
jgi:shikimate dehydrogenase